MKVEDAVTLSELTTLRVGGAARHVITISLPEELPTALAFIRERGLPFVVLGAGSNVLSPDEGYEGVIILMRILGSTSSQQAGAILMTVGAGESWDELVRDVAAKGLWGMENLAGIPGTVGAAPVQNIGAYGAELEQILESVEAFDTETGKLVTLPRTLCGFKYRDSRFKSEPNLIITRVTFSFRKDGVPHIEYPDLIVRREQGDDLSTPSAIGASVRSIRGVKFPDLSHYGTAGSFFKNPIISEEAYEALGKRYQDKAEVYGGIPRYPMSAAVKIPLAFILDKLLGLRGYRLGNAFLFGNQPLVLVADTGAHAEDIELLARDIERRVFDATGIRIEREVRSLVAHEAK